MNVKADQLSQPKLTMTIEKDVRIPMRDGATLVADIFRPAEAGQYPAILNISCYQKDKVWVPPADLEEEADPHMTWETVNPLWWVPRGYICLRIDTRGSGKSAGTFRSWRMAGDRSTCTTQSSGPRSKHGAAATSGPRVFHTMRPSSGGWPACSRRP